MLVPSQYWFDAMSTVIHLLNRLPSKVLNFKTPLQVLASHVSLLITLMFPPRVFECVAYVHLHKNQRTKLDMCACCCLFLGYSMHQKGYRCYDPSTRRTYVTIVGTPHPENTCHAPHGDMWHTLWSESPPSGYMWRASHIQTASRKFKRCL